MHVHQKLAFSEEVLKSTAWPMEGFNASKIVLDCVHNYEEALEKAKDCVNCDKDANSSLQVFSTFLSAFKEIHRLDIQLENDTQGIYIDLMLPSRVKVAGPVASCVLQKVCDAKQEMFEDNEDIPTTLLLQDRITQILEEQADIIELLHLDIPSTAILNDNTAPAENPIIAYGSVPMSCVGLLTQLPPNAFPEPIAVQVENGSQPETHVPKRKSAAVRRLEAAGFLPREEEAEPPAQNGIDFTLAGFLPLEEAEPAQNGIDFTFAGPKLEEDVAHTIQEPKPKDAEWRASSQTDYTQLIDQQHYTNQQGDARDKWEPVPDTYGTSLPPVQSQLSSVWQEVHAGNVHAVSALIQQGLITPTIRNASGQSVLWEALEFGHAKIALLLLDNFSTWNFNETHPRGDTLLHLLVNGERFQYDHSECFRRITEQLSISLFTASNEQHQTFLHYACTRVNFWALTYALTFFYDACLGMIRAGAFIHFRYVFAPPVFRATPAPPPVTPFPPYFGLAKMLTPSPHTNKPPFADCCMDSGPRSSATCRFMCHGVVVAAHSPVVNKMLDEATNKTPAGELILRLDERLSKPVWKCVLQWMYSGVVYVNHLDEPPNAGRKCFELLLACAKYQLADELLVYAVARAETVRDPEALAFGLAVYKDYPQVFSTVLAETCAYLVLVENQYEPLENVAYLEALKIMEQRYKTN